MSDIYFLYNFFIAVLYLLQFFFSRPNLLIVIFSIFVLIYKLFMVH